MLKPAQRPPRLDRETAETIAAQGLAFLAAEPRQLQRFLALTGLTAASLKAQIGTTEILVAVLNYLALDESLLLSFAANHNVAPQSIAAALARLDPGDDP
jgi:hypothetical protein